MSLAQAATDELVGSLTENDVINCMEEEVGNMVRADDTLPDSQDPYWENDIPTLEEAEQRMQVEACAHLVQCSRTCNRCWVMYPAQSVCSDRTTACLVTCACVCVCMRLGPRKDPASDSDMQQAEALADP